MATLDAERAMQYYEYGYAMSPREICEILEELMTTTHWPVYSRFAKEHYGKGLEQGIEQGTEEGFKNGTEEGFKRGERGAVFEVLRVRGLAPTEDEARHINACTDLDQIQAWLRKSVTVSEVTPG
jgi:hypothetical protein